MKSVTYVDNEYICKKGEEGNTLYIIKSGEVRVTNNIEGTDQVQGQTVNIATCRALHFHTERISLFMFSLFYRACCISRR